MHSKSLLVAIATSSVVAGSVAADYMGLDFWYQVYNGGIAELQGTWTVRIYATFSAETDQLNAVFGDGDNPLLITSKNGFYQNPFGGSASTSINPALYSAFPSLLYDSWVTIGLPDQVDNAMQTIGIDWTDFEAGGDISTSNGAWFVTPDDIQATAGADLRVMIGQFTMFGGWPYGLSGVVNLQGKVGDFETFQVVGQTFYIPSPSAIALLGIAGFAIRRRRK